VIPGEGLVATNTAALDLRLPEDRTSIAVAIEEHVRAQGAGVDHEMAALRVLAERVGVDFNEFLSSRLLQIMSAEEIRNLPDDLVDVQLHTHRHRVPLDRAMFEREVQENREYLEPLRGNRAMDGFCYPSGVTNPQFLPWLRDLGVRTATRILPRASVSPNSSCFEASWIRWRLSQLEFEGWLTGIAQMLRRSPSRYPTQID
jgi:peptidoglycan/xylan/chitin deacetylase (PgdA/CDA1 family)